MASPVTERRPDLLEPRELLAVPLTRVALTRWPDLFAAGATLAGMSDLRTFFAGTEPWTAAASVSEYGDPVASLSPTTDPHRPTSPVPLAHGDLVLLPGEGRTVVGRDHLVELSERVAAWLDRWL